MDNNEKNLQYEAMNHMDQNMVTDFTDIIKRYCHDLEAEVLDFFRLSVLGGKKELIPDYPNLDRNLKAFFEFPGFEALNVDPVYFHKMEEAGAPFYFLILQRIQEMMEECLLSGMSAAPGHKRKTADRTLSLLSEYYKVFLMEHQRYDLGSLAWLEQKKDENEKLYEDCYSAYLEMDSRKADDQGRLLDRLGYLMWEYYLICARRYVVICRNAFMCYHVVYLLAFYRLTGRGRLIEKNRPEGNGRLIKKDRLTEKDHLAEKDILVDTSDLFESIRNSADLCAALNQALSGIRNSTTTREILSGTWDGTVIRKTSPGIQNRMAIQKNQEENRKKESGLESETSFQELADRYRECLLKGGEGKRSAAGELEFQQLQLELAEPLLRGILR